MLSDERLLQTIEQASAAIFKALKEGNKILFCGNGGSAADAQHLAAEFSGRFYMNRKALPAEALHCNTSYLTAVANDYSFDIIYSRLIQGIGFKGDVLVGLSTSGNSKNIVEAFKAAKEAGIVTSSFYGRNRWRHERKVRLFNQYSIGQYTTHTRGAYYGWSYYLRMGGAGLFS